MIEEYGLNEKHCRPGLCLHCFVCKWKWFNGAVCMPQDKWAQFTLIYLVLNLI